MLESILVDCISIVNASVERTQVCDLYISLAFQTASFITQQMRVMKIASLRYIGYVHGSLGHVDDE